ncbi:MAG TPA: exodeoxyribonuclease VII large subunit [Chitinophagales bacterium]|nr:exodeoxyribonuclease VII large subunit [Chitinophagales bacterium]
MAVSLKLSELVEEIQETLQGRFEGELYWVTAQITNVKKYESNRRCYLTLEEYDRGEKTAEIKGVFWSNYYSEIEKFEKLTRQVFKSGIEITCLAKVRYHKVYGLSLDLVQIDVAHALGSLELERQLTLDRLEKENPETIQVVDGVFRTRNQNLRLPLVVNRIALITAPNSDGQRDFMQEIKLNRHGYAYEVKEFLTTIQGENAHRLILEQLKLIEKEKQPFDAVAMVRGGGSQTDFKPFDDYELARYVAAFPMPIYTGIGHDRNQSIVDLMARELKTPTKVAAFLVEHNFEFENRLIQLKRRVNDLVKQQLQDAKDNLAHARRIIKLASPQAILNRGFAIVMQGDEIVTDPKNINANDQIATLLKDETIYSTVTKKAKNEKGTNL